MISFKKIILLIISVVILSLFFSLIELRNEAGTIQSYTPLLFALVFSLSLFYQKTRKYLIFSSYSLLVIMPFCYLFNNIDLSNWFGSLGFGILILVISTYIPILIKKGQLDKF